MQSQISGPGPTPKSAHGSVAKSSTFSATTTGVWIIDDTGSPMLDPQTSGLTYVDGDLYTISDASAHSSQIQQLHRLSTEEGRVLEKIGPITLAPSVQKSCFAPYLASRPDYEAIITLPDAKEGKAWLLVTEDARRGPKLSEHCQHRFKDTGSTDHPTLIVRVELQNNSLVLTGVRAIQFNKKDQVGKFDNDGIEGLAMTRDGRVLLGLEKDLNSHPRVFEFSYTSTLFATLDEFVQVKDSGLLFPPIVAGKHPINGMDIYYPKGSDSAFLIAAARNANQLWILDLEGKRPANIVDLTFFASSNPSNIKQSEAQECGGLHQIIQSALEGVAVHKNTLYLINDPWKQRYKENIVCDEHVQAYQNMSPFLFTLEIDERWFQ